MDSLELETVFNAIFDAEEMYGADNIAIFFLNEELFIKNNDRVLNSFNMASFNDSDIKNINGLCDYLNLKFEN